MLFGPSAKEKLHLELIFFLFDGGFKVFFMRTALSPHDGGSPQTCSTSSCRVSVDHMHMRQTCLLTGALMSPPGGSADRSSCTYNTEVSTRGRTAR